MVQKAEMRLRYERELRELRLKNLEVEPVQTVSCLLHSFYNNDINFLTLLRLSACLKEI